MSKETRVLFWVIIIFIIYFIVLPFYKRYDVTPPKNNSLSNLKQIGFGLLMYAEDHNDIYPEKLEQLKVYFPLKILTSPSKPKDFNEPSYIYISGHSYKDAKSKEKYIIVYENTKYLTGYNTEQINVLYLEGYSDRLKKEDFLSELKKTYEHIGKTIPEIKFKVQ